MKLPVIIDATAAAELRDHLARLARENPATARRLNEEVGIVFDLISEFPHLHERFDGDLRRAESTAESLTSHGLAPTSTPTLM